MNIQNIPEILFEFYKLTYRRHLNFNIEKEYFLYDSFNICLENNFNQSEKKLYLSRKSTYINDIRSNLITKELFKLNISPKIYLDFGYGDGNISTKICSHHKSIERFYGVEDKNLVIPVNTGVASFFYNSLNSVNEKINVISCIHTLHHLSIKEQERILLEIYDLLEYDGVLYLIEDTWKIERAKEDFGNADESYIRSILELNDVISNSWFYSKPLTCLKDYYRESKEWLKLLSKIGFEINYINYTGFNSERLHGVPNITIIAKKTAT